VCAALDDIVIALTARSWSWRTLRSVPIATSRVYERYWHGFDASDGHNSHSVTKSLTSALVGIALGEPTRSAPTPSS
jgi:hypothetical protein